MQRGQASHVVPKAVDEYLQMRGAYPAQEPDKKLGNPVHHVHAARGQDVPETVLPEMTLQPNDRCYFSRDSEQATSGRSAQPALENTGRSAALAPAPPPVLRMFCSSLCARSSSARSSFDSRRGGAHLDPLHDAVARGGVTGVVVGVGVDVVAQQRCCSWRS